MGKSAVGKDTLFNLIKNNPFLKIEPVIPYTTRPKRASEKDGETYRFVSVEEMDRLEKAGKILEKRTYHTVKGDWHYFTPLISLDSPEYKIMITTPEAFKNIAKKYEKEQLEVIMLEADEKERFKRSCSREIKQSEPNFKEICRRFIADERDFKDADFNGVYRQFVLNADKSVLRCYSEFLSVFKGIKKNKTDKFNKKPVYKNQKEILEKCESFLKSEEADKKISGADFYRFFGL